MPSGDIRVLSCERAISTTSLPPDLGRDPGRVTTDKTASWRGSHPENSRNYVRTCEKKMGEGFGVPGVRHIGSRAENV